MRRAVLGVVVAMIGAGFATGREITAFFTRFGAFGYVGIAAMLITMALFFRRLTGKAAEMGVCSIAALCAHNKRLCGASAALFALLFSVCGGGMLCLTGQVGALTLPIRGAYPLALLFSLLSALLLMRKRLSVISSFSFALFPCLLLALALILRLPAPQDAPPLPDSPLIAIPMGVSYAGLNAAVCAALCCEVSEGCSSRYATRFSVKSAIIFASLTALFNFAYLRLYPLIAAAELPLIALLRAYGSLGYRLSLAVLFLSVYTTLICALRSLDVLFRARLGGRVSALLTAVLPLFFSLIGFDGLVGKLYPIIGGLSALMLILLVRKRKT